jgi:HTH-type transcriptional regulator / antitoxin MqsA
MPEEIRRIRKKLHLTQEAAGLLIGGGPQAFQ